MTKVCNKCGEEKDFSEFGKDKKNKDGLKCQCKKCRNNKNKIYYQKNKDKIAIYFKDNIEKIYEYKNNYYQNNKEKVKEYKNKYRENNKEKIRESSKKYYKNNIYEINKYAVNHTKYKYKTDENFKIKMILRSRITKAIKAQYAEKAYKSMILLGCTIQEARAHIESLFSEGMDWNNHSLYGWHIDHIKPCSEFDLTDHEQQKKCFHYTNLQPLWAEDNLKKGDKWEKKR